MFWFMYGIGALLEFTVLPGTLSFVLSFDEMRNDVEEHGNSSLPLENETHVSSSQSKAEEQHWSQIVIMVQLILYLPHSISRYMTNCRQDQLKRMDRVDVMQMDSAAILSECGAASIFKEQLQMKKQYRLSK